MAHLGITVASNADQADSGLKRLIATSTVAENAAKRLGATNDNLGKGYDRLKQQADSAAATLARVDRMTGVTGGVKRAAADIEAYGQELERLRAKYNPAFASAQSYSRELEGINYAHRVGAISTKEQSNAIAALNAQYHAAAASADAYQASAMRAQKAGPGAAGANMTNLMFQGQDIAMMTLMGQAPGMLAMQQGMQVGGIFAQMGSAKAVAQGLGGAIAMMLNPLNLATIAFIGLGAAGVQALMSMMGGTEDATSALDRHLEELDKVLEGYDEIRDAAADAFEALMRRPEEAVASELLAARRESIDALGAALTQLAEEQARIQASFGDLAYAGDTETLAAVEGLEQLGVSTNSTTAELDALIVRLTQMANDDGLSDRVRKYASDLLPFIENLVVARSEVVSLDGAIRALDRDVQIRIRVSQEFTSATEGLESLYVDPRSRYDIDRERAKNFFDQQTATAQSYGMLTGAAEQYERVLESINAAEAEANEKANARATKAANKPFDQWQSANDNFQQRIDQMQMEMDLLGKSTFEIERQRAAFDLLNQAKQAGVPITDQLIGQIGVMSDEYANLVVEMERQQQAIAYVNALYDMLGNVGLSAVNGIIDALKDGKIEAEEFGDILSNVLAMAGQFFLQQAFGGGGGGFNILSLFGIGKNAKGTDNWRGGLTWVGEEGPELLNVPGGSKIFSHPKSMAMAANQNAANQNFPRGPVHLHINGSNLTQAEMEAAIARAMDQYDRYTLPRRVADINADPLARG